MNQRVLCARKLWAGQLVRAGKHFYHPCALECIHDVTHHRQVADNRDVAHADYAHS